MARGIRRSVRRNAVRLGVVLATVHGCTETGKSDAQLTTGGLGEWMIVAHRAPGISAMTDAEAAAWHGRAIRFGADQAVSGTDTCASPTYQQSEAPADSLLLTDYRVTAASLGLEDTPGLRLRITEVSCGGKPWMAVGGRVLWVAPDRGFAVWDGVFFELRPEI